MITLRKSMFLEPQIARWQCCLLPRVASPVLKQIPVPTPFGAAAWYWPSYHLRRCVEFFSDLTGFDGLGGIR